MDTASFKAFLMKFIKSIVARCDEQAKADASTIADLSAKASALEAKVAELSAALAESSDATAKATAAVVAAQAAELNALTTELESTFNPSPAADAIAVVVTETPEISTPAVVEDATTLDEPEETPAEVSDAAIAAVVAVSA
jgi:predicted trehalose synthase